MISVTSHTTFSPAANLYRMAEPEPKPDPATAKNRVADPHSAVPNAAANKSAETGMTANKSAESSAQANKTAEADATANKTAEAEDGKTKELDAADVQKLRELKARDREVRAHEQAHLSAAGGHAKGGASYTYERGPDQRMYAIGGEVQVDTSKVANDPVATLRKAQIIRQAALAPVNPSSQDRQVAAQAAQMENEARAELAAQKEESSSSPATASNSAETAKEQTMKETATCPSCGGGHSSGAHDGLTAYAEVQSSQESEAVSHR